MPCLSRASGPLAVSFGHRQLPLAPRPSLDSLGDGNILGTVPGDVELQGKFRLHSLQKGPGEPWPWRLLGGPGRLTIGA